MYYFDRYLIFVGKGDPMSDPYSREYEYVGKFIGTNSYESLDGVIFFLWI
jgi:hypothetical protein